jgi:hypothetical protein
MTVAGAMGLFAASAGCGGSDGDSPAGPVSCTLSLSAPSFKKCTEVTGYTVAQADVWRGSCLPSGESVTAVYADGPCSRVNALGGCRQEFATATITQWFYASDDVTAEDLEMICIANEQTFVTP